jgi:hypothetical protein
MHASTHTYMHAHIHTFIDAYFRKEDFRMRMRSLLDSFLKMHNTNNNNNNNNNARKEPKKWYEVLSFSFLPPFCFSSMEFVFPLCMYVDDPQKP